MATSTPPLATPCPLPSPQANQPWPAWQAFMAGFEGAVCLQLGAPPSAPSLTTVGADTRCLPDDGSGVFVALCGTASNGHTFLAQAVAKGCPLVVVQAGEAFAALPPHVGVWQVPNTALFLGEANAWLLGYPARQLQLVGVTGTNGKTTVTHLIQQVLEGALTQLHPPEEATHAPVGLIGTLGIKPSSHAPYEETGHTTPSAGVLQQALAGFVQQGYQHVAMEVSSHALVQHRVAGCPFTVAVHTNLTQDHLDYHVTMEHYFEAKALLFKGLDPRYGVAVINEDDAWADRFKAAVPPGCRTLTYSLRNSTAHVRATGLSWSPETGSCFTLHTPEGSVPVSLPLLGEFSVYNTLAAVAAVLALGLPLQAIATALHHTQAVRGRFEVVAKQPLCVVDYAHTPDGLDNVLRAARQLTPEGAQLWVVFGCGGDRDATKRPKMGALAEALADQVVITSDNPRTEDPQQILGDVLGGIAHLNPQRIRVEPERRAAITLALSLAAPQDVVVVAGKGHETYQLVGGSTLHFDDREEVLNALKSALAHSSSSPIERLAP